MESKSHTVGGVVSSNEDQLIAGAGTSPVANVLKQLLGKMRSN